MTSRRRHVSSPSVSIACLCFDEGYHGQKEFHLSNCLYVFSKVAVYQKKKQNKTKQNKKQKQKPNKQTKKPNKAKPISVEEFFKLSTVVMW